MSELKGLDSLPDKLVACPRQENSMGRGGRFNFKGDGVDLQFLQQ